MRFGIVTGYFAIMTARFGNYPKSVTIDRNDRSRFPEIIGHVPPKRPVTTDRNTHFYGVFAEIRIASLGLYVIDV